MSEKILLVKKCLKKLNLYYLLVWIKNMIWKLPSENCQNLWLILMVFHWDLKIWPFGQKNMIKKVSNM